MSVLFARTEAENATRDRFVGVERAPRVTGSSGARSKLRPVRFGAMRLGSSGKEPR